MPKKVLEIEVSIFDAAFHARARAKRPALATREAEPDVAAADLVR